MWQAVIEQALCMVIGQERDFANARAHCGSQHAAIHCIVNRISRRAAGGIHRAGFAEYDLSAALQVI